MDVRLVECDHRPRGEIAGVVFVQPPAPAQQRDAQAMACQRNQLPNRSARILTIIRT